jgi:hypothetical protein
MSTTCAAPSGPSAGFNAANWSTMSCWLRPASIRRQISRPCCSSTRFPLTSPKPAAPISARNAGSLPHPGNGPGPGTGPWGHPGAGSAFASGSAPKAMTARTATPTPTILTLRRAPLARLDADPIDTLPAGRLHMTAMAQRLLADQIMPVPRAIVTPLAKNDVVKFQPIILEPAQKSRTSPQPVPGL